MELVPSFTCIPAVLEQFKDPRVGAIVRDLTVRQCEALNAMVAAVREVDIDEELRWGYTMLAVGMASLAVLTIAPTIARRFARK
jgi:hypothetical protein